MAQCDFINWAGTKCNLGASHAGVHKFGEKELSFDEAVAALRKAYDRDVRKNSQARIRELEAAVTQKTDEIMALRHGHEGIYDLRSKLATAQAERARLARRTFGLEEASIEALLAEVKRRIK